MLLTHRGLAAAALAGAIALSLAAEPAFAQATTGPAGGVGSTTAPSNSEGTPAGGTGTLGTTRVGPSTTDATTATPAHRHRRHRHRHAARHATPSGTTGTQSDSGLNGSAAPSR